LRKKTALPNAQSEELRFYFHRQKRLTLLLAAMFKESFSFTKTAPFIPIAKARGFSARFGKNN